MPPYILDYRRQADPLRAGAWTLAKPVGGIIMDKMPTGAKAAYPLPSYPPRPPGRHREP